MRGTLLQVREAVAAATTPVPVSGTERVLFLSGIPFEKLSRSNVGAKGALAELGSTLRRHCPLGVPWASPSSQHRGEGRACHRCPEGELRPSPALSPAEWWLTNENCLAARHGDLGSPSELCAVQLPAPDGHSWVCWVTPDACPPWRWHPSAPLRASRGRMEAHLLPTSPERLCRVGGLARTVWTPLRPATADSRGPAQPRGAVFPGLLAAPSRARRPHAYSSSLADGTVRFVKPSRVCRVAFLSSWGLWPASGRDSASIPERVDVEGPRRAPQG